MWSVPTFVEDRDLYVVLLDFEGLNQPLRGAQSTVSCDCKLFSLAILASSVVLFNSKFKLDEKAVE